ncbi:hypothetical protein QE429_001025 [Bacillus sp. SORGH_AS 510]|uniref:hypothetical protein n=1 Tax=Bacillus sp. SORGH_AS_0510 TaxID=3041771 RepID=UPI002780FA7F|nr:hypothetical protein [Bacillus sp. SORGH_AS_0510]MDQ1144198.1 hypothetical protein [Bacillus sp. SORGH_AS_0510]
MQKIALIQNQVYMSYASKSDIRPLLATLGYDSSQVNLYTAHNIKKLKNDLDSGEIDAVVFSSNSLSEKSIKAEVATEIFINSFSDFLNQGKGCLILHQLNSIPKNSGEQGAAFDFLPMKSPKVVKRENEDVTKGELIKSRMTETHPLFTFPNTVSVEALKEYCIQKKGLYWHYLDYVESADWDVLLHDETEHYSRRPLLIATRESSKYRVVISSLNLDWQREEILLKNLLTFVREGKCNTAVIKDKTYNSMAFEFFLKTLDALNYRYKLYDFSDDIDEFKNQIEQGTHSIVVLGPTYLDEDHLEKKEWIQEIEAFLYPLISDGKIKYIGIEPDEKNLKQFFVAGREKSALRILQDTEIKLHRVLQQKKLIDDSFWSSVDTLKVHSKIKPAFTIFTEDSVNPIFTHTNKNLVEDAAYNGLLVPTSALLWLRASYLGTDAEETRKTVRWMKDALLSGQEVEVECVIALNSMLELEIETEFTTEQLTRLVSNKELSGYNEIEIVPYIKAAILLKDIDKIKQFISTLESKKNEEKLWIDISISANIVNLLLEALVMLKEHDAFTEAIEKTIEDMVFPTVIIMQNMANKNKSESDIHFHWENKANTTLKCVSAMLKFEELMDLPVTEMVQSLLSYSQYGNLILDNQTALLIIDEYKEMNSELKKQTEDLEAQVKEEIQKQITLADEKDQMEEKYLQEVEKNKKLKEQNEGYEEKVQRHDLQVTNRKRLMGGIVALAAVIVLGAIFFFNNDKAFKDLVKFYNLEWNVPTIITVLFTTIAGVAGNSYLKRNKPSTNQRNG